MTTVCRLPLTRQSALIKRLARALRAFNTGRLHGAALDRILDRISTAIDERD